MENVDKEILHIEETKKSVVNQRESEAAELQGPYLKRYSMLLDKRDGLAVVAVSALTGQPVDGTAACTGEISVQGRVKAVGGVPAKEIGRRG